MTMNPSKPCFQQIVSISSGQCAISMHRHFVVDIFWFFNLFSVIIHGRQCSFCHRDSMTRHCFFRFVFEVIGFIRSMCPSSISWAGVGMSKIGHKSFSVIGTLRVPLSRHTWPITSERWLCISTVGRSSRWMSLSYSRSPSRNSLVINGWEIISRAPGVWIIRRVII